MEPVNAFPQIYKLLDRVFIVEEDRYIKRELTEDEYFRRPSGQVVYPYWMRGRIQNEADAIAFIQANTSPYLSAASTNTTGSFIWRPDGSLELYWTTSLRTRSPLRLRLSPSRSARTSCRNCVTCTDGRLALLTPRFR